MVQRKNSESPWVIEPQTFGFEHLATETLWRARPITKFEDEKYLLNFGNPYDLIFKCFHESVIYARVPVQNNIISKFFSANVELFNTQEDVTFISQLISLAGNASFLKETVFK